MTNDCGAAKTSDEIKIIFTEKVLTKTLSQRTNTSDHYQYIYQSYNPMLKLKSYFIVI